jgi:DNA-binding LacI/PurR family transcriptional regulator
MNDLQIAGAKLAKKESLLCAIRTLHDLGHRRMVMLCHEDRRIPKPGEYEQNFLDELQRLGVKTSGYNLPNWDETTQGYHEILQSLFSHTPPSALLIDTASLFNGAHQFLSQRKLRVPQDVSLICGDPDPSFEFCFPHISHIRWESEPIIRNVLRWAHNISKKKEDFRQKITPVKFIEGGTIGPNNGSVNGEW